MTIEQFPVGEEQQSNELNANLRWQALHLLYQTAAEVKYPEFEVVQRNQDSLTLLNAGRADYVHQFIDNVPTKGVLLRSVWTILDEGKDRHVTENSVLLDTPNSIRGIHSSSLLTKPERGESITPRHNPLQIISEIQDSGFELSDKQAQSWIHGLEKISETMNPTQIPEQNNFSSRVFGRLFARLVTAR